MGDTRIGFAAMGKRSEYAPGAFSWTDLSTPDPDAAKRFYGELLGWEYEDSPVGDGRVYTMISLGGDHVAALQQLSAPGQPPAWLSYVTVDDADAATDRATGLGGSAMMEPFDVMDAGRMALLADPQGAVFAIWQAKDHPGAGRVNDPGAMSLNQLNTSDVEGAREFYSGLFGWSFDDHSSEQSSYWAIRNAGSLNGGMMPLEQTGGGAPPHWFVYFTHADLDSAAQQIASSGGHVAAGPMPIEAGRILIASDPQAAFFGLFEGEVDP